MIFDYPLIYSLLVGITVYFIIYLYTINSNNEDNQDKSNDICDISFKLPLLTSIISYVFMIYLLQDYNIDMVKQMSPTKNVNQIILMDEFN